MKKYYLLLWVVLGWFAFISDGRASPSTTADTPSALPGKSSFTQTFKVWGATDEFAQQEAVERARRFLEGLGERQQPPRVWRLTTAEVRHHFLKALEAHPEYDKEIQGEVVKCWSATIAVTPAQLEMLDRRARTHERMGLLAKLFLLAVMGTATIGGYLRLEEWANWRHTLVPRFLGAILLVAAGAGMWLVL